MVFLTYRHESPEHSKKVLEFAQKLELAGVDVGLDQLVWQTHPAGPNEGWPRWCTQTMRKATHVLIVASKGWFAKFNGDSEPPDSALGAGWEAREVFNDLYKLGDDNSKYRIVELATSGENEVPSSLYPFHRFAGDDPLHFDKILAWTGTSNRSCNATEWLPNSAMPTWPFADAVEVKEAFCTLLTKTCSYQALIVRGDSETGKTTMSKHMLDHAIRIPGLSCGRLDLKGGIGLEAELAHFSQQIFGDEDIPNEITNQGTSIERMRQLFIQCRKIRRRTLWIIDTFDKAQESEFGDWLENTLFPSLVRSDWLRIVITGQHLPTNCLARWPDLINCIELKPATQNDWVEYGSRNRPGYPEETLRQVYDLASGKGSTLQLLLGPKSSIS